MVIDEGWHLAWQEVLETPEFSRATPSLRWAVTSLTQTSGPVTQTATLASLAAGLTITLVTNDRDLPELEALPLMLTADHVANLLGVSRRAIYKMRERGELPVGRKIGRRLRFPRHAIKAYLLAD